MCVSRMRLAGIHLFPREFHADLQFSAHRFVLIIAPVSMFPHGYSVAQNRLECILTSPLAKTYVVITNRAAPGPGPRNL